MHSVSQICSSKDTLESERIQNRPPLLALKIRTPVANTGKLRSIGQVPVLSMQKKTNNKQLKRKYQFADSPSYVLDTELYYQINITCI